MSLDYQRRANLPRLHYVTQGETTADHLKHLKQLCEAGCPWIQLRLKELSTAEYETAGRQALELCRAHGTLLTINDNWEVALAIQADGIHVGKTDQAPALVRAAYPEAIIGATANTWEEVQALATAPIDYIGLGPLRFTSTKKKLSPILGMPGYQNILQGMKERGIDIPILAIGGVLEEDVALLHQIGVWGIAVSGLLTQSDEKELLIKRLLS
ncbi:MAG: thiamine phosphate synthase [Aureispira sp.]